MISKDYGEYQLECDCCGKYIPGFDSFDEAVEYAKEEGWKTKQVYGEWENTCEDCEVQE